MKPTYKLLITTSGTGSRLGKLTQNRNKALIDVGGKTAIAHILDRYDSDIPLVVTLGYLGNQIREYLANSYPDRSVEYITVDHFEGPGTSCGYSMLAARAALQCPFVFHACDTIVFEPIPSPTRNWTAGYLNHHIPKEVVAKNFTTQSVTNKNLARVNPLGTKRYDYIHMGITGIFDHATFWDDLESLYRLDPDNARLTDIDVINKMIEQKKVFEVIPFNTWLDVGNSNTLEYTQNYFRKRE